MSAIPVRRALVTGLVVWCCALPASAELIQWIDERGTVHFAESVEEVPAPYRSQLEATPSRASTSSKGLQILGFEERRREKATAKW